MKRKRVRDVFSIILTLLLFISVLPMGAYVHADKTDALISTEETQANDAQILQAPVETSPDVGQNDTNGAAEEAPVEETPVEEAPVEEVPTDVEQPAELPDESSTETETSVEETQGETVTSDSEQSTEQTTNQSTEQTTESSEEDTKDLSKIDLKQQMTVNALAASDPDVATVPSWVPTNVAGVPDNESASFNNWQVVSGNYFGTQQSNTQNGVTVKKDVIASGNENLFYVALKVKEPVSWREIVNETGIWLKNGNDESSAKEAKFLTEIPTGRSYVTVSVEFYATSNITGDPVLVKPYYVLTDDDVYNNGQWFLLWDNPLLSDIQIQIGNQKQKIENGSVYKVPLGDYITHTTEQNNDAVAMNVVDPLGEGLTFDSAKNIIHQTGGTAATYDSNTHTINWSIHPSGTIDAGTFDNYVVEGEGADKTLYREYDLLYSVHLDASREDFVSGQTYHLNETAATLTYKVGTSETIERMEFPIPSVKGTLYALTFTKQDEDTEALLAGATFTLDGNYGVTEHLAEADIYQAHYALEKTSVTDGKIIFENLPWGTYTLTETEAPEGYDRTFEPMAYTLSYTTNPENLVEETDETKNYDYKYLAGKDGVITNKRWAEAMLTIKKVVNNQDAVVLDSDEHMKFPIFLDGYNREGLQIYDENRDLLTQDKIDFSLEHNETKTFYIRMKEAESIDVTEQCAEDSHFEYVSISSANAVVEPFVSTEGSEEPAETGAEVTLTPGKDTEVIVTNHYIPQVASVSLHKVNINDVSLAGAEFDLYTTFSEDPDATEETLDYKGTTYYKLADYTTHITGLVNFENLDTIGNAKYLVVETKAPAGYYALKEKIEFHFDEDDQAVVDNVSEDFKLDGSGNIKVINREIYNLPGSGGRGTAVFTTIGLSILMGAILLVVIDRQRKGVH